MPQVQRPQQYVLQPAWSSRCIFDVWAKSKPLQQLHTRMVILYIFVMPACAGEVVPLLLDVPRLLMVEHCLADKPCSYTFKRLVLLLACTGDIVPLLLDVLRLLMAEHRHAFRPSLEHTAALVAALLPSIEGDAAADTLQQGAAWGELTCQALRLLRVSRKPHAGSQCKRTQVWFSQQLSREATLGEAACAVQHTRSCNVQFQGVVAVHPSPKKAFIAVAGGKLLLPLLRCAFPAAAAPPGPQAAAQCEEARSLLQSALFHTSHIPGKLLCGLMCTYISLTVCARSLNFVTSDFAHDSCASQVSAEQRRRFQRQRWPPVLRLLLLLTRSQRQLQCSRNSKQQNWSSQRTAPRSSSSGCCLMLWRRHWQWIQQAAAAVAQQRQRRR